MKIVMTATQTSTALQLSHEETMCLQRLFEIDHTEIIAKAASGKFPESDLRSTVIKMRLLLNKCVAATVTADIELATNEE